MMSKEAMKLALEAMERYQVKRQDFDRFADEITALREALAEQPAQHLSGLAVYLDPSDGLKPKRYAPQPAQQEPVAWIVEDQSGERLEWASDAHSCYGVPTFPLYTFPPAQRTWVGLSPADRGKCLSAGDAHGWIGVMEATEARLKELNT